MTTDNFNPPNSVWPNGLKRDEEGYVTFYPLGTNKVDISTVTWPEGTRLVSPFVYQGDKLIGFCDTKAMTAEVGTVVNMPYEYIEVNFPAVAPGTLTIDAPNASDIKISYVNNITLGTKYINYTTSITLKNECPNYQTDDIINGIWSQNLKNLTTGGKQIPTTSRMFYDCTDLTTFVSDLSSLVTGYGMFSNCKNLTTFSANLSNLNKAHSMFSGCKQLTNFECGSLASLQYTTGMFSGCKLNANSMKTIVKTIPDVIPYVPPSGVTGGSGKKGYITIGFGCNTDEEDKNLFAQEVGFETMEALLEAISSKGWIITAQYNGRPISTYSLRQQHNNPIFVKLEETSEYPTHTSIDNTKTFFLDWFHETTGSTEGYTQFNSIEEAVAHYNIKPIERN